MLAAGAEDRNLKQNKKSIALKLYHNARIILVVMLATMMTTLSFIIYSESSSRMFIQRMAYCIEIKTIISETIPGEIYDVLIGRTEMNHSKADELMGQVEEDLEMVRISDEDIEYVVVLRTMDTYKQYIQMLRENIRNEGSVDESIRLLNNVRDVGELIRDMVDQLIHVYVQRESVHNHQVRGVFYILASCILLSNILAIVLIMHRQKLLSNDVADNIELLDRFSTQIAAGHFDQRISEAELEELKPLSNSLNDMASQLERLIEQVREEEEKLKIAELKTLQAQINPHFLYNTLDTILWQAEADDSESVIRTTQALSNFFRISLSSGEEWIPLYKEVEHLEGYLIIQKTRYRDILHYEIHIDEDILNCTVLKLLLQPLVENALYHGIKNKRGGGSIIVSGKREGNRIRFCIKDTGRGMDEEMLASVRESIRKGSSAKVRKGGSGSGFGLSNVNMRICLYYHQQDGIDIQSDAGGTTVEFSVPIIENGEKHVQGVCG